MQTNSGFTMTELLVVVSIITIIIVGAAVGGVRVLERAQAQKMVSDFKEIETAWLTWQSDTHIAFPSEDTDDYLVEHPCTISGTGGDAVLLHTTHIYLEDPDSDGLDETESDSDLWNGPYLDRIILDPYGREYELDNDPNTPYNATNCSTASNNNIWAGVNISQDWCTDPGENYAGEYLRLVNHINSIVDGNEGNNAARCGKFRWTPGRRMFYMIEDNN